MSQLLLREKLGTRLGPEAVEQDDEKFADIDRGATWCASKFALKSGDLDDLLAAIRVVAEREALLASSVTERLIAH